MISNQKEFSVCMQKVFQSNIEADKINDFSVCMQKVFQSNIIVDNFYQASTPTEDIFIYSGEPMGLLLTITYPENIS